MDRLSALLQRLDFRARVFLKADFCGAWAVDTSGERQVPFHLVTRGVGWLHQGDAPPAQLSSGHLVLFPRDGPHILASSDAAPDPRLVNRGPPARIDGPVTGLVCGYFSFARHSSLPLLDGLPESLTLDLNDPSQQPSSAALVQLWMAEAATGQLGCDAAVDHLAYVVFIHVLRAQQLRGGISGVVAALADPRLGPVLDRIHRYPGEDQGVTTMAALANMSRSSFAQRFKQQVGMTPAQYARHWRMTSAYQMLRSGEHSVAAVAEGVGYDSEVAFRKAFRKFHGIAPGAVRRGASGDLPRAVDRRPTRLKPYSGGPPRFYGR